MNLFSKGVGSQKSEIMTSEIALVDLAGSERLKDSGATGETQQEAQYINKSLSALGNCIKVAAILT